MKKKTIKQQTPSQHSRLDSTRHEQIFSSGEEHYKALLTDIANAQLNIDFESYIFSNDEAGQEIAQGLTEALDRGVAVRVLVDGFGSPFWASGLARMLEKAGAQTKIYNPFPWQVWNWQRSTRRHRLLSKWLYLSLNINTRNHRKTTIIDKHTAYIGSFNVHKCHLPRKRGGFGWRDTSVRISGSDLTELSSAFEDTWNHQPIHERLRDAFHRFKKNPRFRLNTSRYTRRILFKNLLKRLRLCQEKIWVTSAYFIPNSPLVRRLKEAARRGIDVRLLLPDKSDIFIIDWAALTYYKSLLKSGVRIFQYKPAVLHAKSLIIDDWMLVGSTNLNSRSLLHDLEVDAEIQTTQAKQDLHDLYIKDLSLSEEITLHNWERKHPLLKRLVGRVIIYFRYFI
jgi:cardiolipin synthase A/B